MRISEVNTIGDFKHYVNNYETSLDNYDLYKEQMEIELMKMVLNIRDSAIFESDDKAGTWIKLGEKTKNFLKKSLEWFIQFVSKAITYIRAHVAKINMANIPEAIEKRFATDGGYRTGYIREFNDKLRFFHIAPNTDIFAQKQALESIIGFSGLDRLQLNPDIQRNLTSLVNEKLDVPGHMESIIKNIQSIMESTSKMLNEAKKKLEDNPDIDPTETAKIKKDIEIFRPYIVTLQKTISDIFNDIHIMANVNVAGQQENH